jgi:hypothetical protein
VEVVAEVVAPAARAATLEDQVEVIVVILQLLHMATARRGKETEVERVVATVAVAGVEPYK